MKWYNCPEGDSFPEEVSSIVSSKSKFSSVKLFDHETDK